MGFRLARGIVLLLSLYAPCAAVGAEPDAVARGAYLAAAAGCDACHTDSAHGGRPYAGGRKIAAEFGTISTPNLTPDPATGLGRWSIDDFRRAMRWGVAPDDSHYVPIFPFPFYNRLTERDLSDLKAFLDSLAPVSRPNLDGPAALALIPRVRAAIAIAAAPQPGPWQDDPSKDRTWNRGAYLAATVGRCGQCHTPTNFLGIPDATRFLAGGHGPDGKITPNVTPDRATGIGNWSESDIVGMLTDGHTPSFDDVGGSMAAIVKNTARLSEDDRRAIAVYVESVAAVSTPRHK